MAPERKIRNWDRTLSWTPTAIHRPGDTEEVADVVGRAAARGERVKAIGSALSWSDAAGIADEVVLPDGLRSISVDRAGRRVMVQSGAELRDVNEELARHGLAFENFGSISMQTAGGYTGTGTHGTGGRVPILSAFIESMVLVDGRGEIRELSAEHEPELFSAARVHLGCLGVVTEITFRCTDAFDLEERLELVEFDDALGRLDDYVDGNDYCKLWWLPYSEQILVYRFNKTTKMPTRPTLQERFDSSGMSGVAFGGLLALSRAFPALTPSVMKGVQSASFQPHSRVDRSDKIIKYAGAIPRHQETEYAIDRSHAAEAIERVRRIVLDAEDFRVNFPMEIRFVAADDIPMSPVSGRDSCYLGGYVASKKWAVPYFAEFEGLMREFDGRPHWGKSFSRTAAELRDLYPGYEGFDALRRECDPRGVFVNDFVDRVFPDHS